MDIRTNIQISIVLAQPGTRDQSVSANCFVFNWPVSVALGCHDCIVYIYIGTFYAIRFYYDKYKYGLFVC